MYGQKNNKLSTPMIRNWTSNSKNNQGQGIMEYIILTSLVGIVCLIAVRTFGRDLKKGIQDINAKVRNEINIHSR